MPLLPPTHAGPKAAATSMPEKRRMRPFIGAHDTIEPMRAVHVLFASAFAAVLACGGSPDAPPMTDRTAGGPPANVLDPTFGTNGIFTWGAAHEQSERGDAVIRQADGKIVVAALNPGAHDYVDIVRLTREGALDPTFGDSGTGHAIIAGVASTHSVS